MSPAQRVVHAARELRPYLQLITAMTTNSDAEHKARALLTALDMADPAPDGNSALPLPSAEGTALKETAHDVTVMGEFSRDVWTVRCGCGWVGYGRVLKGRLDRPLRLRVGWV